MTLAADGHHVKVHQMVMSLVSPFIKELITSANCPHPVVFLNRVSYVTLQYILEYVYTGQVVVAPEALSSFLEACSELHINGLEDLTIHGHGKDLLSAIDTEDALEKSILPLRPGSKRKREPKKEIIEYLEHDPPLEYVTEEILAGEMDGDETYDEEIPDKKSKVEEYSLSNEMENYYVEIEPYKAGSRWFNRGEHYYIVTRTKGRTTYLRCASEKCPARWTISRKNGAGPVVGAHDHEPTPWMPLRNSMFQSLRRRAQTDNLPLSVIYEQEARRYPEAVPYMTYDNVKPSMRKWRRTAKLMSQAQVTTQIVKAVPRSRH